jgi:GT2 family glycosyltransferase
VGFPRANNQALARAQCRYVLYLNPDTEVGKGTLAACVRALESDPGVGVVGCRLVYPDGETQLECARHRYLLRDLLSEALWLHMFFPRSGVFNHHLMADWDHRGERDVDAISGAFMMARREVAEAVGGLPEDVFMYHEDLSFCLRVQGAGWRIRYLGDVTTVHYSGRSATRSPARLFLLEGEVKVRLIREAQGRVMGGVARAVFGLRSLVRLLLTAPLKVVPGLGGVRRKYPRVFHLRKHVLQMVWSVAPWAVRSMMPVPDERGRDL